MTIAQMLNQRLILTLLGMGVVFLFLIVMIFCMHLLHTAIHAAKLDVQEKSDSSVAAPAAPSADKGAVVAAIAAAIHEKN